MTPPPFTPPDQPQTMVYTVDLGDGTIADVEGPPDATPEQLQAFMAQQGGAGAGGAVQEDTSGTQTIGGMADELPPEVSTRMKPEDEAAYTELAKHGSADELRRFATDRGFQNPNADEIVAAREKTGRVNPDMIYQLEKAETSTGQAFGDGLSQGATLGTSDEIHGFLNGVMATMRGEGYTDTYNRTVDEDRAMLGADQNEHPVASGGGNIIGGLALPVGLERAGVTASVEAVALAAGRGALRSGLPMAEARIIAARAATRHLATEGAAYGGAYGAGTSEGGPGERLLGAVQGAAVGAGGGVVLGGAARALGARVRPAPVPATDATRTAAAAARQGVDLLPADVGGPTIRRLTGAAAQAPLSAAPVINAARRTTEQAQGVRDAVARSIGTAVNPEAAGQYAISGARSYLARTSGRARQLYGTAEAEANGARVTPTGAMATIDRNLAELSETPGGAAGLARLQGLRDALDGRDFTIGGIGNMRASLRDDFSAAGLRGSDIERRVNQVVDAASGDIETSLANQPAALAAYRTADRYWRNRIRTIDTAIEPIVGKDFQKSGKQVVQALQSDAKGNSPRLFRFLSALPDAEQRNVRATLINHIGRSTKGAQNDEGTAFSLQTFLSNYDDLNQALGEGGKARLFGVEGRAALNDIATIANGTRQAQSYANRSNTSGGIWGNIGALAGGASIAPHAAAFGFAAQLVTGRMLSSPRVARWLARSTSTRLSPTAYIERLTRIAKAEPAIASDVLHLQQRLASAFGSTPAKIAADEPVDETGGGQGNAVDQQRQHEGLYP